MKTSTFQMYGTVAWDKEANTLNENMEYDHNGNILKLTRKQNQRGNSGLSVTSAAQTIDDLTYTYASGEGNRLTKVEDAGTTSGFNNASTQATEYVYDANGSMTEDKNKGVQAITYNFLGKPQQITFTDGRVINYTYDAAGTKLKMSVTQSSVTTTTDYVGNFVYQNNALSFFGSPEGRVIKNGSNLEYQYALSDHQGNTRVLFTSATPAAQPYTATLENGTQTNEQSNFQNYPTGGNRSSFELFDHTDFSGSTYTYSQLLNAGNNSQVGLAKSFKVYPGDKVKIEAYAKYYNPQSTTSNLAGFAGALTAAFGVSGASTGEALKAFNGLNSYGGIIGAGGGGGGSSYPKAFVNILLFDKDYNFLDIAYEQINGGEQIGASPKAAHDYMSREYTVKEVGYAFMYISNESPTNVETYFDDVVMSYTPSNIVQYNEYYPFGLSTASSWTRENNTGNNFLYNESTELNPSSGYYDLFFRNFDPALGRFMQVDPLASYYHNQTPYQYGNNDPVYWSDPSGAGGDEAKKAFDRADGDFDALNLLAAGGGMFGASYNMMTYGSSYGFGGATSIGGFGSNYHGYWEKYLSGGHYEITGARNPTSLDAGGEGESYWVSEYSRRFIETKEQDTWPNTSELHERFGESFKKDFVDPIVSKYSGKSFDPDDLLTEIENFDYAQLKDSKNQYSISPVHGRLAVGNESQPFKYDKLMFNVPFFYQIPLNHQVINPGMSMVSFVNAEGDLVSFTVRLQIVIPQ